MTATTKPTDQDFLQFQAVLGASIKGVPLDEAVTKITGNPNDWSALVDRVLYSFGDLEVEA